MDKSFLDVLHKVTSFLESHNLQYAIIGGIANQIWGQTRFTLDIDIKVLVPDLEYEKLHKTINRQFPKAAREELPANLLIKSVVVDNVTVDFLFATPGFEEQLVNRAIKYSINDFSFIVCTAEDLIIQKAIADRMKDWLDIEGIVLEQQDKLDQPYIDDWLKQFSDVLEKPEILSKYDDILKSRNIND